MNVLGCRWVCQSFGRRRLLVTAWITTAIFGYLAAVSFPLVHCQTHLPIDLMLYAASIQLWKAVPGPLLPSKWLKLDFKLNPPSHYHIKLPDSVLVQLVILTNNSVPPIIQHQSSPTPRRDRCLETIGPSNAGKHTLVKVYFRLRHPVAAILLGYPTVH